MDNKIKVLKKGTTKEIEKKQKSLGKLDIEQKGVYAIVNEKILKMSKKEKMKILMKKSKMQKLINDTREEMKVN